MTLLQRFRSELEEAIKKYEKLFAKKKMSRRRARDCVDLLAIINNLEYNDDDIKERLKKRLALISTGWWIFKTGNSRLKDNLNLILNNKKYIKMNFLLDRIKQLESQQVRDKENLEEMENTSSRKSTSKIENLDKDEEIETLRSEIDDLKGQLKKAERLIQSQHEQLKSAESQLSSSLEEKIGLFLHNQELQKENHALVVGDSVTSPSSELTHKFNSVFH